MPIFEPRRHVLFKWMRMRFISTVTLSWTKQTYILRWFQCIERIPSATAVTWDCLATVQSHISRAFLFSHLSRTLDTALPHILGILGACWLCGEVTCPICRADWSYWNAWGSLQLCCPPQDSSLHGDYWIKAGSLLRSLPCLNWP